MKKGISNTLFNPSLFVALTVGGMAASMPVAYAADTLVEALSTGKVSGQLRYRYEWVDDATKTEQAGASTLRTRLGYMTGDYLNLAGFIQLQDVRVVGSEHYNSTVNGRTQYPTVADPESAQVQQAFLSYKGLPDTVFKYGRQGINLDNQRFIGTVEWRQNAQAFDAFTVTNNSLPDTTIFYGHVMNVRRIFGENSPQRDLNMSSELLNIAYKGFAPVSIVGYGYFLDYDKVQTISNTLSNKTLGLRFDGGYKPESMGVKFLYTAEYAKQSKYAGGASTVDGDYTNLMAGVDVSDVQVKLGHEVLSGNGTYGFATPLATLHAFNGWADKFLATPNDGIKDTFLSAGTILGGVNLTAVYRKYSSDNLGYDYGSEWNLQAAKKINKSLVLTAKYAAYSADANATNVARNTSTLAKDIDKFWLMADVQF
ncbi:MAG: alginate export family protein [Gammaproteobacteria bacterium]